MTKIRYILYMCYSKYISFFFIIIISTSNLKIKKFYNSLLITLIRFLIYYYYYYITLYNIPITGKENINYFHCLT